MQEYRLFTNNLSLGNLYLIISSIQKESKYQTHLLVEFDSAIESHLTNIWQSFHDQEIEGQNQVDFNTWAYQ